MEGVIIPTPKQKPIASLLMQEEQKTKPVIYSLLMM